ncbi:type II toxin-antitoxin system MqsR family toxin [Primorskyibacter sp. 2E107]|uniref:type II toxin-antitoxin system MqsR family toxin n=1 Tax=Primorskyibacter sp. 2E107 TaxID=3403458 RepID=UPI003AF82D43
MVLRDGKEETDIRSPINSSVCRLDDGNTNAAMQGAAEMGVTRADMIGVIKGLSYRDFYKSMTTPNNHRVWMDVYHGRADGYEIYIKFVQDTVAEFTCTSFKEK